MLLTNSNNTRTVPDRIASYIYVFVFLFFHSSFNSFFILPDRPLSKCKKINLSIPSLNAQEKKHLAVAISQTYFHLSIIGSFVHCAFVQLAVVSDMPSTCICKCKTTSLVIDSTWNTVNKHCISLPLMPLFSFASLCKISST